MKLNGRRMSDNINDRRGEGLPGGGGNGMGLLGLVGLLGGGRKRLLIVAAVIVFALVTQGPEALTQMLGVTDGQQQRTETRLRLKSRSFTTSPDRFWQVRKTCGRRFSDSRERRMFRRNSSSSPMPSVRDAAVPRQARDPSIALPTRRYISTSRSSPA